MATTVVFLITTILLALMALAPGSAPIKTGATQQAAQADIESELVKLSTRFTESLITFNYKTVKADIARLERDTTEGFPSHFHSALRGDMNVYRKRILDTKAVSTGDVKGATMLSIDDDTGTVLVFASQTVRSKKQPSPATRFVILELTLLDGKQGWKVDSARVPTSVSGGT